ncbi:MAG: FAD-dependent oxidoreductase, partial [Fibrobacterota bacterium]
MDFRKHYDCIVVGGGPGGVCAAKAAASRGASTLLIERYGFLGGMATAGLVNPFMSYRCNGQNIASPIFNTILQELKSRNALCRDGLIFNDEVLKYVLDTMMNDSGVDVLFHSALCEVDNVQDSIHRIKVLTKSGLKRFSASVFIDSTGDGDLASLAGVPFESGRDEDCACQPLTLCFRVSGITGGLDAETLGAELTDILNLAKKKNEINQPREDVLVFNSLTPGTYHFNTTRVLGKNGTCSVDLTDAEIEGRRQTFELLDLFRKYSPRFKGASLVKLAAQIGVRETRRIKGLYTISEEDILGARKFHDGIVRSSYPVDIHNPAGSGTVLRHLPKGQFYEVPLRSLIPVRYRNLIIGSRCVSSTHEAHSSLRVMPVVAGIGEAAGLAAAAAAFEYDCDLKNVDGRIVKQMIFREEREDSRTMGMPAETK